MGGPPSAPASASVQHGRVDGFATVVLAAGELTATFVPGAGMACCSLRHRGEEMLALRDGLASYAERGKTMGIPLLYPWANRLSGWDYDALGRHADLRRSGSVRPDAASGLPIHGTLPGRWRIESTEAGDGAARLATEQTPGWDPEFRAAFPFEHTVRLEATLDAGELRIATTVLATGATVPVCFGFHPYLSPPGATRADYRIELPPRRRLALDERKLPTGEGEDEQALAGRLGDRAFDDAYAGIADGAAFGLEAGGRRIVVRFESGYPYAQVYAPPGKDLICFEPMTARADALRQGGFAVATPGEPYTAAFAVAVA